MWRMSRSNSIIRWQDYRVSASRLAESNFRYTHLDGPGDGGFSSLVGQINSSPGTSVAAGR
jgi:hypothetical protein